MTHNEYWRRVEWHLEQGMSVQAAWKSVEKEWKKTHGCARYSTQNAFQVCRSRYYRTRRAPAHADGLRMNELNFEQLVRLVREELSK